MLKWLRFRGSGGSAASAPEDAAPAPLIVDTPWGGPPPQGLAPVREARRDTALLSWDEKKGVFDVWKPKKSSAKR
jgi:hypothetical protein